MNRLNLLLVSSMLIALLASMVVTPAYAAPAADTIVFNQLGVGEQTLQGPFATASLSFGIPATWKLNKGTAINLAFDAFVDGADKDKADTGAFLRVLFNGLPVQSIPITQTGKFTANIPIPVGALTASQSDGQHTIGLALESGPNCFAGEQISVIIDSSSRILLSHESVALPIDLSLLPRPIFQDSFIPEAATMVVPDKPSADELQSALIVAATFGRMTNGQLSIDMTPLSKLDDKVRNSNHLIFVGMPASLKNLTGLKLPAPVKGNEFDAGAIGSDDGIIQLVVSPWNEQRAVLVVSGASDKAVVRAAHALSTGNVSGAGKPNVAIVTDVSTVSEAAGLPIDRRLSDLGYEVENLTGAGDQVVRYRFEVPPDQPVGGDTYLNLIYNNSTLIDYGRSSAVVRLNGQPISSVRLSSDSAQLTTVRINLPQSLIRFGSNELEVNSNLIPQIACSAAGQDNLWMAIWPESLLHLPSDPSSSVAATKLDLSSYPAQFTSNSTLSSMAFVVPADDSSSWLVASQMAFRLGRDTKGDLVDLRLAYGDALDDELRKDRDLVVIGRPTKLGIIADLNQMLPAPFEKDSDVANNTSTRVAYRVQKDMSIGYLQLLASPWNSRRLVLAVLGNTSEGVRSASDALIIPELHRQLKGNFAMINGNQITISNAHSPGQMRPAPVALPGEVGRPVVTPIERPSWIIPVIAVALVLMFVIIGYVVFSALRQWRTSQHSGHV